MSVNALKDAVLHGAPEPIQPSGWPQPKGYANGMKARGTLLMTGGLIGWDAEGRFPEGLVAQIRQALANVVAVLEAGGSHPSQLMRMTWYVTDIEAYRNNLPGIGAAYRETIGRHFPAMALVQVVSLVEREALVDIEASAVIPD